MAKKKAKKKATPKMPAKKKTAKKATPKASKKKASPKRAVKKAAVTCTVVSVGGTSKLTPLQDRFNLEYIIDFNGTAAYQRSSLPRKISKETAAVNSSKLLRLTKVQKRIAELIEERQKRMQTKADDAMNECCRIAFANVRQAFNKDNTLKDIHDIPEDVCRAISSVKVDEIYSGTGKARKLIGYSKEIKFWSKDTQIKNLFMHHGLFAKDNAQQGKSLAQLISEAVHEKDGK